MLVDQSDKWGKTIGRAGGIGNDSLGGLHLMLVDAKNKGRYALVLGRSGDDDFGSSGFQMGACSILAEVDACALQDNIHPQVLPGQGSRILLGKGRDLMAIYADESVPVSDLTGCLPVGSIVFKQMGQGTGIREVVDGDQFDLVFLKQGPVTQPAYSSKTIDCNSLFHN